MLFFFGKYAALIFLDEINDDVVQYISTYFRIHSIAFVCLCLIGVLRNTVQGLGFGAHAMISAFLELTARCTFAIAIIPSFGFTAACAASPVSWLSADLCLIPLCIYVLRKLSIRHPDWCNKPV